MTRARVAVAVAVAAWAVGAACTPDPERGAPEPTGTPVASPSPSAAENTRAATGEVVTTTAGKVRGTTGLGLRIWAGVPFAQPPVGDLRWRAPQPVRPWKGVRSANAPGAPCLQSTAAGIQQNSSEDCLYLNVQRPASAETDLPVLVEIHGGGLIRGQAYPPATIARELVRRGVVVVSIQYRLGWLGYFAHPALAAEAHAAGTRPVGNFGLLDQIAALAWVRDNIGAFGGDPHRVTISGMSAGGASVNYLMASPRADGLFHRAIARSSAGGETPPAWSRAARRGERIAASLGAPDATADELRGLDGQELAKVPAEMLLNEIPIRDPLLPEAVGAAFAAGREADVPYLTGSTDLEFVGRMFSALGVPSSRWLDRLLVGRQDEALAAYGGRQEIDRHLLNDVLVTAPVRSLAEHHAANAPTYRYRFGVARPTVRTQFGGALHGTDLPYAFGVGDPRVVGSARLARQFSECTLTFVRDGRPDCGIDWPHARTGGLVEFTNAGPVVHDRDPWARRLDFVAGLPDPRP